MAIKPCPECGTSIALTSKHCSCGWSEAPRAKANENQITRDWRCQWRANGLQCRFPVGLYEVGATDGFCLFHRNQKDGATGAEHVMVSQKTTREDYLTMARVHAYGPDLTPPAAEFVPSKTDAEAQKRTMEAARSFNFAPPPSRMWAKKILERHAKLEDVGYLPLRMAAAALDLTIEETP